MSTSYIGGCACGRIRYKTSGQPVAQNHCQCRNCQKRSGTGHGSYLAFADRTAMTISGEAREWRVAGDSGNDKIHAFCPACGTPVYVNFAAMPDIIAIHAGSLDDPEQFEPQFVTYRVRGNSWDTMDAALPVFDGMPTG